MTKIISFLVRHPVWGNVILYSVLGFGIISFFQMNYSLFPELQSDFITIQVIFPGASPQEMEEGVVLKIEENFSSLGWHITANFEEKEVSRPFIIKENLEVEFSIEDGKLIIRNKGNIRYTRTVKIKIGDQTESYTQNIPINGEKNQRGPSDDRRIERQRSRR